MSIMICNQCKDEGKSTEIPYDEIGIALMQQHLEKEHDPLMKFTPSSADHLPGGTYTGNEDYDPTEHWL